MYMALIFARSITTVDYPLLRGGLRRMLLGLLGGVLVVCFLLRICNQPQPAKKYLLWEKVAQMPLLTYFFLGFGWPWVGEFVGFVVIFICFPTRHNLVNRKHPVLRC